MIDNTVLFHTTECCTAALVMWQDLHVCMQVPVADTVGCGDSFAAAVLMGFTRGHGAPATLALANAVGGATAMGKGAGAMPDARP